MFDMVTVKTTTLDLLFYGNGAFGFKILIGMAFLPEGYLEKACMESINKIEVSFRYLKKTINL